MGVLWQISQPSIMPMGALRFLPPIRHDSRSQSAPLPPCRGALPGDAQRLGKPVPGDRGLSDAGACVVGLGVSRVARAGRLVMAFVVCLGVFVYAVLCWRMGAVQTR